MIPYTIQTLYISKEKHPSNSVIYSIENYTDAILCMEELIKYNRLSTKALLCIIKVKIKQRDFFEASYATQRAQSITNIPQNLQIKLIERAKFVDGVMMLIKRKNKAAINAFSEIMKQSNLKPRMQAKSRIMRAYAYIMKGQYDNALTDYQEASVYSKPGKSSIFNKFLCVALKEFDAKNFAKAEECFTSALEIIEKKEAVLYRVSALFQQYFSLSKQISPNKLSQLKAILDDIGDKYPKDTRFYYYKGLLLLFARNFLPALSEFEKAIEYMSDEDHRFYMFKGKCNICLSMFKEAINDFTEAIKIKKNFIDAYLYRGKCLFLIGQTNESYQDFQKMVMLKPEDPMMHIYAGNILLTSGAYPNAIKAFTNASKLGKEATALYQRAKCHLALSQLQECYDDLKKCSSKCNLFLPDFKCVESLYLVTISAIKPKQQYYEGSLLLNRLINKEFEPSGYQLKFQTLEEPSKNIEKMEYFNTNEFEKTENNYNDEDIDEGNDIRIFQVEDFYLYKGVMSFYMEDYTEAIKCFEQSQILAMKNKNSLTPIDEDRKIEKSIDTDLSDIGLCSLNTYEYSYNIILCYIQSGDYAKALEKLNSLIRVSPSCYGNSMHILKGLLIEKLNQEGADAEFKLAYKHSKEKTESLLKRKQSINLETFPETGRLCTYFPYVILKLGENYGPIAARLSFSAPFIRPPNIIPVVDKSILNEFTPTSIMISAEAPWVRRFKSGIMFTEEIKATLESSSSKEVMHVQMKRPQVNKKHLI